MPSPVAARASMTSSIVITPASRASCRASERRGQPARRSPRAPAHARLSRFPSGLASRFSVWHFHAAAGFLSPRSFVRPAWAPSCGCKSRRKETIPIEANRNCGRATDCGEEAGSETAGRCTRTGSEATPSGASGQTTAKLRWSRLRRRKFGDRAVKDGVLTWGDLASRLKGRRAGGARSQQRS